MRVAVAVFLLAVKVFAAPALDEDLLRTYQTESAARRARVPRPWQSAEARPLLSRETAAQNKTAWFEFRATHALQMTRGFPLPEVERVLADLHANPIVSESALPKYDPSERVGFCFGRAAFAHGELLRRGADPADIAKAFAVGHFGYRDKGWDYHVATFVRATDQHWYVIDGLRTGVLPAEDWMAEVRAMDQDPLNPTIRFYFTAPEKFLPTSGAYEPKLLHAHLYNGYFRDLENWWLSHPPSFLPFAR